MENLVVLWLAAFPLMGSPGPATMSLAGIGAAYGVRKGLPWLAGICVGTSTVVLLIATGVTGIVLAVPALATAVTFVAAAYILYLAWKIATAPPVAAPDTAARAPSFAGALALAIANPKAYAAIGAAYTGVTVIGSDVFADAVIKASALVLVVIIVNPAWLGFGSLIAGVLRDPRLSRVINVTFAVLLVVSVALALIW